MKTSHFKRVAITIFLSGLFIISVSAQKGKLPIAEGPFKPTDESLTQFKCPEWFRDAKFGIWAHWGPQAVPAPGRLVRQENVPGERCCL